MTTTQQSEALLYFNERAQDWKNKAVSGNQCKVNVIQQRNGFVIHVVKNRARTESMLDVGCGSGDLVCDTARMEIDSTGVDFAPEMIAIAQATAKTEKLEAARFYCCSIFDFDFGKKRYDVISANGFIEYISLDELDRFLALVYDALNPKGSFVLGSRNRLFNVFSINSFTSDEINNGTVTALLSEAVALAAERNLEQLTRMDVAPLQKRDSQHADTGIAVSTRYQFTPVQLMKMLKGCGFTTERVHPVHIHGVPPIFKESHPDIHTGISNLLQNFATEDVSLIPHSSSFMLHAIKG